MHRAVLPLLLLGCAPWAAQAWWHGVDGVDVAVSIGLIFRDMLGATPQVAWEPAQNLVDALLRLSPGAICVPLAIALQLYAWTERLVAGVSHSRHVEAQRRALLREYQLPAAPEQDNRPGAKRDRA
jgi:hypothetical protein